MRTVVEEALGRAAEAKLRRRAVFAFVMLGAWLAAAIPARPAAAGPFDDAISAHERGDYAAALRLLRPLAEQGNACAQFNLGFMYANGEGVPQDYAAALKWYRRSADQFNPDAQYNLGFLYDKGLGVPQDYAEAVKWYRRVADRGNANAQNTLGIMYSEGRGVPQDHAEAMKWFRRAADQGYADAQNNLGVMYASGQGVPQDFVQAYRWYSLAATGSKSFGVGDGELAVRNRDDVAAKMTPAQIKEAQKLVRDWKPNTKGAK